MHTSRLVSALLFGGLLALGSACSGVDDGAVAGESEDELAGRQRAACDAKACGDTCTLCNGRPNCFETQELKTCGGDGKCTSRPAICEAVDAGPAPSPECANKGCGDVCSTCPPGAICPAVIETCNAQGQCSMFAAVCDAADAGPAPPCAGKACGERCSTCTTEVCAAVVESCDSNGACVVGKPVCQAKDAGPAYEPCGGKLCGDPCTLCLPGDPSCIETAVLKFCQPDLKTCRSGVPACGT